MRNKERKGIGFAPAVFFVLGISLNGLTQIVHGADLTYVGTNDDGLRVYRNMKTGSLMTHIPKYSFVVSFKRAPNGEGLEFQYSGQGFLIGNSAVTNKEFTDFAEDVQFRTTAELSNDAWTWKKGLWKYIVSLDEAGGRHTQLEDARTSETAVVNVSWTDAAAYCIWSNTSLPSPEEWMVSVGWAVPYARSLLRREVVSLGLPLHKGKLTGTGYVSAILSASSQSSMTRVKWNVGGGVKEVVIGPEERGTRVLGEWVNSWYGEIGRDAIVRLLGAEEMFELEFPRQGSVAEYNHMKRSVSVGSDVVRHSMPAWARGAAHSPLVGFRTVLGTPPVPYGSEPPRIGERFIVPH